MTVATMHALPRFPRPLPAEAPPSELTRDQKLELSFNYIISRIREASLTPLSRLPYLMGGKGNLCSLAAKKYGISRHTLQDYLCSQEDRDRLPAHLASLASSLYSKTQNERKEACLLFIQSEILKVKEDLRKHLPLLQSTGDCLVRQAEKKYGHKAGTIVHWIYPSKKRGPLMDVELASLAYSIAPLYREVEKAKKTAAYQFMISKITACISDPRAPLPNLTMGKGGLYSLASKEFHLGPSELQSLTYGEICSTPENRELASLASSIHELHRKAWRAKVHAALSSIKSSVILLIKDPSLPLPRLAAGPDSLFHRAALEFNFSERTISSYCREEKARYHLHDAELSELASSISPLYKLALFIRRKQPKPLSTSKEVEIVRGHEFKISRILTTLDSPSGRIWWKNAIFPADRTILLRNKQVALKAVENGFA